MSSGSSSSDRAVIRSRVVSTRVQPSETRTVSHTTTRVHPSESRTTTTTRIQPVESRVANMEARTVSHTTTRVVKQMSSSTRGGKTVTETTVTASKSATPQVRTVTRTTTRVVASPSKKAKISDIITGLSDETVTAREALLKWAQRTTERYPGVRVTDFTSSWKDGLAFNAILHRNRPELLDFRSLRTRSAKDNLELAFSTAEKEFGITRLLDPEDVDTPEIDEKSLITYISSMYDVFQEPPSYHPFADEERNRKVEEYKDLAKNLHIWMHESLEFLCCEKTYTSLIDLKSMLLESSKFRSEEMPKRSRDKQRLAHLHREIQKMNRETSHVVEFLNDLKLEEIEKKWNIVVNTLQERDKKIRDEICKLEKLQKLVEKFNRESKICDGKLDDLERRIKDEEKRVQRLHFVDAKHNCDQIESELKHVDELLKSLKKDIVTLEDKKYHQTIEMKSRLGSLRERYEYLLNTFQAQLQSPLSQRSADKNGDDRKFTKQHVNQNDKAVEPKFLLSLKEHFEWIDKKSKRINQLEFGVDLPTIKSNAEQLKQENKAVEQYNKKIVACSSQKLAKENDAVAYTEELQRLQIKYKDLVKLSAQKLQEAESLLDFVQSATREFKWMNDKEEIEVSRDWSAKNLNLSDLEHHQEVLTGDLEKREIQFNAIQNRGESLLLQKHSASKVIESFLTKMQSQWSWLLQLTLCLEIHLRCAQIYHQYFKEVRECEQWIRKTEEKLNTTFSKSIFSIDEGEKYLKDMQELKDDLARYNSVVISLIKRSSEVLPLKMRRGQSPKPINIVSICSYKNSAINLNKDEKFILRDASQKVLWKVVAPSGNEVMVPGVCFIIPPPNSEAVEAGKNLKKKYDDLLNLWTLKQRKLRQNLILATIKVVKSWDVSQLHAIEITQRESIMKALNADAEKLLLEGSSSEPALIKLKEEIEQCNILFNSLVKKLSEDENEKSPKSAGRKLSDTVLSLQNTLNEKEKFLRNKLQANIIWDLDTLENQVIEHKEFETGLKLLDEQITQVAEAFKNTSRKTTALQLKYDTLVNTWDKIWELSNCYVEKLKIVEVALHHLTEATQTVSNIEVQLASCDKMSSNLEDLQKLHDNLLSFQGDMQLSQNVIDDVQESARKVKELVQKIRPKHINHTDINKYENDVRKLVTRWNNSRSQIVERLRSCGATSELLQTYKSKVENDNCWISETTVKVNSLKSVKRMTTKEIELSVKPTMNLYTAVAEKSSSIEGTNTLAARYIREAKIYDLRLKHYKENLEEEHPSLDASLHKKTTSVSGADDIESEIQDLNLQYLSLLQSVLSYLEELKMALTAEQKQKWESIISAAVPITLKTCSISEPVISSEPCVSNRISIDINQKLTSNISEDPLIAEVYQTDDNVSGINFPESTLSSDAINLRKSPGGFKSLDSKTLRSDVCTDELMSQNIYLVRGIYNPKTGKMITMYEAVEQNILNFENEEFCDVRTGRKMSLKEAVIKGFLDEAFYERITMKCGIYLPSKKEELSLVDAIKENMYDLKTGNLLNPLDCKPITITDAFHLGIIKKSAIKKLISMKLLKTSNLTISEALEKEFLNPETGMFHDPLTNSTVPFSDAIEKGLIKVTSEKEPECGISLTEAIDQNIIHDQSGQILDKDSGERYTIDEAIFKGILRSDIPEIVDIKNKKVISLKQSLDNGILNAQKGIYVNNETYDKYSLKMARARNLIFKPLTLKDAFEMSVIDDHGITDTLNGKRISLLEALSSGILDTEAKCIVDSHTSELVSLPEALERGIILPNGQFFDATSNQEIPLSSAVTEGLVTSVSHKMIFDIEGIMDSKQNELISFNTALERNIIHLDLAEYTDTATMKTMSIQDAVSKGLIQDQIFDMISKPIGIKVGGKELTLLECCQKNIIDCKSGQIKDPKTNKTLYMREAIEKGVITPDGAALLKGLMNITVTMATITRTITRFVDVPSDSSEMVESSLRQEIFDEIHEEIKGGSSESMLSFDDGKYDFNFETTIVQDDKMISAISSVSPNQEELSFSENLSDFHDAKEKNKFSEVHFGIISKGTSELENAEEYKVAVEKHEIKPSVQVLELPPDGWYLSDAIKEKLFDSETGLFTVPGTDRLVSFEETVKLEIINPKSALVLVPKSKQSVSLDSALEMRILDSTGHYNTKTGTIFSMQKAIEKNLIILCDRSSALHSKKTTKYFMKNLSSSNADSETDQNAFDSSDIPKLNTVEENLAVCKQQFKASTPDQSISNDSLEKSFSKQEVILLQRIPKKVLSPKDALIEGFIDQETCDLLNKATERKIGRPNFVEFVFNEEKIDTNKGKILDYQLGEFVSIKKAIEQGMIDKKSGKILVPIGFPLTFPEAQSRGLIHEKSQKIIHPENGDLLNIEEAIICDIINPLSVFINPRNSVSMTISEGIHSNVINSSDNKIHTPIGDLSLSEAISKKCFKESVRKYKQLPLLSLTFPTALQYGYIDIDAKEFIYPNTNKRVSVQKALELGDLMVVPVQPQQEYFLLDDALNRKLIDPNTFTFKHPVSGKTTILREAMQSGLLVTKPVRLTVTPTTYSTVQEVIGIETCVSDSSDSAAINRVNEVPISIAIKEGLVDLKSGTFYCSSMQKTISIPDAIQLGILKVEDDDREIPFSQSNSFGKQLKSMYDNKSESFTDPVSGIQTTFENLIKNNFISLETIIYITGQKRFITLKEAIDEGIINLQSGEYITNNDEKLSLITASKLGYLLFMDSSILQSLPIDEGYKENDLKESVSDFSKLSDSAMLTRPTSLSLGYKTDTVLQVDRSVREQKYPEKVYVEDTDSLLSDSDSCFTKVSSRNILTQDMEEFKRETQIEEYFSKTPIALDDSKCISPKNKSNTLTEEETFKITSDIYPKDTFMNINQRDNNILSDVQTFAKETVPSKQGLDDNSCKSDTSLTEKNLPSPENIKYNFKTESSIASLEVTEEVFEGTKEEMHKMPIDPESLAKEFILKTNIDTASKLHEEQLKSSTNEDTSIDHLSFQKDYMLSQKVISSSQNLNHMLEQKLPKSDHSPHEINFSTDKDYLSQVKDAIHFEKDPLQLKQKPATVKLNTPENAHTSPIIDYGRMKEVSANSITISEADNQIYMKQQNLPSDSIQQSDSATAKYEYFVEKSTFELKDHSSIEIASKLTFKNTPVEAYEAAVHDLKSPSECQEYSLKDSASPVIGHQMSNIEPLSPCVERETIDKQSEVSTELLRFSDPKHLPLKETSHTNEERLCSDNANLPSGKEYNTSSEFYVKQELSMIDTFSDLPHEENLKLLNEKYISTEINNTALPRFDEDSSVKEIKSIFKDGTPVPKSTISGINEKELAKKDDNAHKSIESLPVIVQDRESPLDHEDIKTFETESRDTRKPPAHPMSAEENYMLTRKQQFPLREKTPDVYFDDSLQPLSRKSPIKEENLPLEEKSALSVEGINFPNKEVITLKRSQISSERKDGSFVEEYILPMKDTSLDAENRILDKKHKSSVEELVIPSEHAYFDDEYPSGKDQNYLHNEQVSLINQADLKLPKLGNEHKFPLNEQLSLSKQQTVSPDECKLKEQYMADKSEPFEIEHESEKELFPLEKEGNLVEGIKILGKDIESPNKEKMNTDAFKVDKEIVASVAKEKISPRKELKSVEEDELPKKDRRSLQKETAHLNKDKKSPEKEAIFPNKEKEIALPKKDRKSPDKETTFPKKDKSSEKEIALPNKDRKSPEKETAFPKKDRSLEEETAFLKKDTKSSEKETTSPKKYRKSPEKETTSPKKDRKSPDKETTFPKKDKSSEKEIALPNKDRKSPEKETAFPKKDRSLEEETAFPKKDTKSPEKETTSPKKDRKSPDKETTLPKKDKPSEKEIALPNKDRKSPEKETAFPKKDRSLEEETAFPKKDTKSPEKETTSPKKDRSPEKETTSPKKDRSPEKETISPKKDRSPEKETTSPNKDRSPEKETISPKKDRSPEKEITIPKKDKKSPEKESVLPKNERSPEKETGFIKIDRKSPEKETAPFIKGKKSPEKETAPFIKDKKSPEKETAPFIKDKKSPEKETAPFIKDKKSPEKETAPFIKDKKSPEKETAAFIKDKKSPEKETAAFIKDKKSPEKETAAFIKDKKSPEKETAAFIKDKKSSEKETATFIRDKKSPQKETVPLIKDKKYPEKEITFHEKDRSPEKETAFSKKDRSLEKESVLPKKERSPEKETAFTRKDRRFPEKETTTFITDKKSPEEEMKPIKASASVKKEKVSPTKEQIASDKQFEKDLVSPEREKKYMKESEPNLSKHESPVKKQISPENFEKEPESLKKGVKATNIFEKDDNSSRQGELIDEIQEDTTDELQFPEKECTSPLKLLEVNEGDFTQHIENKSSLEIELNLPVNRVKSFEKLQDITQEEDKSLKQPFKKIIKTSPENKSIINEEQKYFLQEELEKGLNFSEAAQTSNIGNDYPIEIITNDKESIILKRGNELQKKDSISSAMENTCKEEKVKEHYSKEKALASPPDIVEEDTLIKEFEILEKNIASPMQTPSDQNINEGKQFSCIQKIVISKQDEDISETKFRILEKGGTDFVKENELLIKEHIYPENEKEYLKKEISFGEEYTFSEDEHKQPETESKPPVRKYISDDDDKIKNRGDLTLCEKSLTNDNLPEIISTHPDKKYFLPEKSEISSEFESNLLMEKIPSKEIIDQQTDTDFSKKEPRSVEKENINTEVTDINTENKQMLSPEKLISSEERYKFSLAHFNLTDEEQVPSQKETPEKQHKSPERELLSTFSEQKLESTQKEHISSWKKSVSPEEKHQSLEKEYLGEEDLYGSMSLEKKIKDNDFESPGIESKQADNKEKFSSMKNPFPEKDILPRNEDISAEKEHAASKEIFPYAQEQKDLRRKPELSKYEKECEPLERKDKYPEKKSSYEKILFIDKTEFSIDKDKSPDKDEAENKALNKTVLSQETFTVTSRETSSFPEKELKDNFETESPITDSKSLENRALTLDEFSLSSVPEELSSLSETGLFDSTELTSTTEDIGDRSDVKIVSTSDSQFITDSFRTSTNVSLSSSFRPSDNVQEPKINLSIEKLSDLPVASTDLNFSSNLKIFPDASETYSISQTGITVQKSHVEITKQVQLSNFPVHISVKDAIDAGIINSESCYVIINNNKMLLNKAIDEGLVQSNTPIEVISGEEVIIPDEESTKSSSESARAAIEENYKVCEENSAKLTSWMKDIEEKLAEIGILKEQLPGLQHQMNTVKILKDELENQQHLVLTCLDQMRQLAQRGLEVLDKEEINTLQKNLISLKRQYDCLMNESDRLLRRLTTALEELQKFKSELNNLRAWLASAEEEFRRKETLLSCLSGLDKNSDAFRNFTNDVIAHQADLRFITMAAQKFINESQEYLKALNAFRQNLPQKLSTLKITESEIKSEVHEITTVFHNFLNNVNRLQDNFMIINNKYRSYAESVEKVKAWMADIKNKSKKSLEEPIADEPIAVQEQLDKIKLINMEVVGQSRLVENVLQSVKILNDTLENSKVIPQETKVIEDSVNFLQKEYSELVESIASRIKELQTALIQSQDIQDAVDRIMRWLEEAENTVRLHNRPVSLIIDKLDEQVQEFKILKSDVDNQKQSIDMLFSSAKELNDATNPKLVKKVDTKITDISQRFDKLCEKISKRGTLLEQVSESVRMFQSMSVQFDEWSSSTIERIESTDSVHQMDLDGFSSVIEYTLNQCNSKKEEFENMIKLGKNLITKKDITDVSTIKDKIQTLEQRWKNLENTLNEKKLLGKAKADQIAAYDTLRIKVLDWLLKIEREVEKLEPLALEPTVLKKQASETVPLLKEHSDFSTTMEKLNSLGCACDAAIKGETSKQKAISPYKKPSSPTRKSPSKSKSTDSFAVSPVKGQVSAQSPLSTVSSGFSSRRSSADNIGSTDELTPIQFQMSEMNDRYNILGAKLNDRNQEISVIKEEVKYCQQIMKSMNLFLEEKEKQLSKEDLPSRDGVEKHLKCLQDIHNEFLEKQSELDNLKSKIDEMISKRKMAKGAAEMEEDSNKTEKKWIQMLTNLKERIAFLQNLKEFHETQLLLKNWLAQKEKMFGVLGPIASDPRMVTTQVQQVQVMRDEFTSQKSFMDRLNDLASSVLQYLNTNNLSTVKVTEQMDVIHQLWNDISAKLNEREKNLEAASGISKGFHKNLTELQVKLQQLNEKFDKFEDKGFSSDIFLKKLGELEDELEKLRLVLSDVDSVCEQLCDILSDSSSKSDIKYKVTVLETSYTILRKKIDNKKAEIESAVKEDNIFFKSCTDIQNWITEIESLFSQPLSLSADLPKLTKQSEDYEPVYKQIMNREYEVHLCLNKGSEMLPKLTVKQDINSLKARLDTIKKSWEKLKKMAVDRNTLLRSTLETCKKFATSLGSFIPWLESEEETLKKITSTILQRESLNKKLKELQIMKSNISVHQQEYENMLQLGENLLSTCDSEKDVVKKKLDNTKKKWKVLSESVISKIQLSEDILQMLMEYEEKVRDLQHTLQRLEDRLSSHDAFGDVSHDTILLERLQALLSETKNMNKEIKKIKDFSKKVIEKAGPDSDSSEISNNLSSLENRYQSLLKELESRCVTLQASYKVISVFMEHVKSLKSDLNSLDEGFDKMNPVARDQKVLKDQLKEIKVFKTNLSKAKEKLTATEEECQKLVNEQCISDSKNYVEQIKNLERLISRLEERVKTRESNIEVMVNRLETYFSVYTTTIKTLQTVIKEEASFEVIGGDVETIRSQKQTFKEFRESKIIPLNKQIGEVNKLGQGLVQSATAGVNTNEIEQQLEKLNSLWNNLQESINEREKKLDIALLQSGKFQEALIGVEKWLKDTEEMVANQKGPASDFKVVKAQIQEQKFLKKMLLDRQNSVISLKSMGTELMSSTKSVEFEQAEKLLKNITVRFEELISSAEKRMSILEKVIPLAQEFQTEVVTVEEWLEITEKKLLSMSSVPVEDDRLKHMIAEQKTLKEDINSQVKAIEHLKSVSEKLIKIINVEESEILKQKVSSITEKYSDIKQSCENIGKLLKDAKKELEVSQLHIQP